ncbi:MAG TPA: hypothetical protein ENL24_00815 [candidate division Zixibacteria bacterium]|nr:hypothetical protein [candidate division Zixibacteria bacterium]
MRSAKGIFSAKPKVWLVLIIIAYFISRFALLKTGFGLDPDAWRIANSAFDLHFLGYYHPSRLPGYPLPELIDSILITQGWIATNLATSIISLLGITFFYKILSKLRMKLKLLITISFALMPSVWINSANSMDYMWATSFLIMALYFLIDEKVCISAILLGLSSASRMSNAIFVVPFAYWILSSEGKRNEKLRKTIYFLCLTIVIAGIFYIPIINEFGLKFFPHLPGKMTKILVAKNLVRTFGLLPCIAVPLALIYIVSKTIITKSSRRRILIFSIISMILVFGLFAKIPYEACYLLPIVPIILLALTTGMSRKALLIISILLIQPSIFTFRPQKIIDKGAILKNIRHREQQLDFAKRIISEASHKHSVFVIGTWLPVVTYLKKVEFLTEGEMIYFERKFPNKKFWDHEKDVWFAYLLTDDDLNYFKGAKYEIFFLPGIDEANRKIYGVDLRVKGAKEMPIH